MSTKQIIEDLLEAIKAKLSTFTKFYNESLGEELNYDIIEACLKGFERIDKVLTVLDKLDERVTGTTRKGLDQMKL